MKTKKRRKTEQRAKTVDRVFRFCTFPYFHFNLTMVKILQKKKKKSCNSILTHQQRLAARRLLWTDSSELPNNYNHERKHKQAKYLIWFKALGLTQWSLVRSTRKLTRTSIIIGKKNINKLKFAGGRSLFTTHRFGCC